MSGRPNNFKTRAFLAAGLVGLTVGYAKPAQGFEVEKDQTSKGKPDLSGLRRSAPFIVAPAARPPAKRDLGGLRRSAPFVVTPRFQPSAGPGANPQPRIDTAPAGSDQNNASDLEPGLTPAATSEPSNQSPTRLQPEPPPPPTLGLKADVQRYDGQRSLFIAEGNVQARINGGLLQADRVEFDTDFNTLAACGKVRFRKGSQCFQASSLRFNLIENSGVLRDVYGVLDLDSAALDLNIAKRSGGLDTDPREFAQRQRPALEDPDLGFFPELDVDLNDIWLELDGLAQQTDESDQDHQERLKRRRQSLEDNLKRFDRSLKEVEKTIQRSWTTTSFWRSNTPLAWMRWWVPADPERSIAGR